MTTQNTKSTPTPPSGYRLLEEGEYIRKTDLYKLGAREWKPSNHPGGRWNPRNYWPMARKIEKEVSS